MLNKKAMEQLKELLGMGFTHEQAMQMMCASEQPEVATAKAVDAPPKPKYFMQADNEVVMERDGSVCRPTYAKCKAPAGSGIYAKEIASAIWHVNNKLIEDEFGEDVEFKAPKRGHEPGYVCKSEKVAKQLQKFELRQGISKAEWNAWCDMKTEQLLKEVERLEGLKVK